MNYIFTFLKWTRKLILYKVLKKHTRGVRIILRDQDRILLVKHPYDTYWVFPGGGIDKNESPEHAARREISEETSYIIENAQLFASYQNTTGGKRDTVYLFTSTQFKEHHAKQSMLDSLEIQKYDWFTFPNLPPISKATQQRIDELLGKSPIKPNW